VTEGFSNVMVKNYLVTSLQEIKVLFNQSQVQSQDQPLEQEIFLLLNTQKNGSQETEELSRMMVLSCLETLAKENKISFNQLLVPNQDQQ
jgi:hypothetical protein